MNSEKQKQKKVKLLKQIVKNEVSFFLFANGYQPYEFQRNILSSNDRNIAIRVSRQGGKTQAVATKALRFALTNPFSLVLITSPSIEKSSIVMDKIIRMLEMNSILYDWPW